MGRHRLHIDKCLSDEMNNLETGEQHDKLKDLQNKLREEIGVAWTFARRIGEEAVLRNALKLRRLRSRTIDQQYSRLYKSIRLAKFHRRPARGNGSLLVGFVLRRHRHGPDRQRGYSKNHSPLL